MRQQQTKNLGAVFAQVVCDPLHEYSLRLIRAQTDKQYWDVVVYNTTRAHAAELRGVTFRCGLGGLANHNTLGQLANLRPLRISKGGAS